MEPNKEMSRQLEWWNGDGGNIYIDRNHSSFTTMDKHFLKKYGIAKSSMFSDFLPNIDESSSRILEVGCSIGLNLDMLIYQFCFNEKNLYGIEPSDKARSIMKDDAVEFSILPGTANNIPFKDSFFELCLIMGVHIHIPKIDLIKSMEEIYRVSNKYILSFEYYSEKRTEVEYRGKSGLLWKDNYRTWYQELFPDLKLVKEEFYPFMGDKTKLSTMFLLEKV